MTTKGICLCITGAVLMNLIISGCASQKNISAKEDTRYQVALERQVNRRGSDTLLVDGVFLMKSSGDLSKEMRKRNAETRQKKPCLTRYRSPHQYVFGTKPFHTDIVI